VNANSEQGVLLVNGRRNAIASNTICENPEAVVISGLSEDNTISANHIEGGDFGVSISGAGNSTVSDNALLRNKAAAIHLNSSRNISINGNDIRQCPAGLLLESCRDCRLSANNLSNSASAILLRNSSGNSLEANSFWNCNSAIRMAGSSGNSIQSNALSGDAGGMVLEGSSQNNLINNTVEVKDAGIALISSSGCSIMANIVKGCHQGVKLVGSSHNRLCYNNISGNFEGLYLDEGVYPQHSSSNEIYLNSFMGNSRDVYSFISSNSWISPEAIPYQYKGRSYSSRLGNYWAAAQMNDQDNDGICDSPHNIGPDVDDRPLIEPHDRYSIRG